MNDQQALTSLPLALLASDQERGSHWLEHLLDRGGYAVLRERSGPHTLQRARATQPDVIVVDDDLRGMRAVELCRALRGDAVPESTPILLSTNTPIARDERLAALQAGVWECITPPHDADEIVLKLDAYVHAKLEADRARAQGLLDPVTGIYNRQGLVRRARELGAQAFREHGALACVALALDLEPGGVGRTLDDGLVMRCVHGLKSSARLSDVIGRLGPTEFGVLAPDTDAAGARRLAERLTTALQSDTLQVRCGYEAIGNVGYAPIEPVELLLRASAAVRTGRAETGRGWLRRFDEAPPAPRPA